ncbi:MAG: LTA synthase family protein, partial [Xanthomonadales bacterium]|nr:LTA synthase family protein [Xanthomonadales bacterium]
MKPQAHTVPWHHGARYALLIVLWLLALVLWTSLIDTGQGVSPELIGQASGRLFINALPGLLLAITLLALTRRALLSVWLAWLVVALIYAINALKIDFLASPLMPSDFRMIGQLQGGGGELLSAYLPHSPWPWIGIVVALLVTIALALREPASFTRKLIPRVLCGGIALFALVSLIMAAPAWKTIYDAGRLGLQPWSAMRTADHAGLFSSLALYRLQYANAQHKPDIAAARALIASKGAEMDAQAHLPAPSTRPDIIIVQSESFFDPGILNGYHRDVFSPQLARLQRRGDSGSLHVPTFGGGTIRTE